MQFFSHYRAKNRPGLTLLELMIFFAIVGMMMMAIIPMLVGATETRQRQDAIALVEQNGIQVLQEITQKIQSAERILYPPIGESGIIIALQMDTPEKDPTIIAMNEGAIVIIEGRDYRIISSEMVGVTSFSVDNTSVSEDYQSATVSLDMRRVIRQMRPITYTSHFDMVVNLYPDDVVGGNACGCLAPACGEDESFLWWTCVNDICIPYQDFACEYET